MASAQDHLSAAEAALSAAERLLTDGRDIQPEVFVSLALVNAVIGLAYELGVPGVRPDSTPTPAVKSPIPPEGASS